MDQINPDWKEKYIMQNAAKGILNNIRARLSWALGAPSQDQKPIVKPRNFTILGHLKMVILGHSKHFETQVTFKYNNNRLFML